MITTCDCTSAFQDAQHGKQRRVHTRVVCKTYPEGSVRCTVCGRVKRPSDRKKGSHK